MVGVRAWGPPTMEPGNPPQIGYASCKATIGKSQPVRKFEVKTFKTFPTSLCAAAFGM